MEVRNARKAADRTAAEHQNSIVDAAERLSSPPEYKTFYLPLRIAELTESFVARRASLGLSNLCRPTPTPALRDQPMTPIEEATYWAEWVLRHPDIDLASPSINLTFFVRHSLDLIVFFLVATLAAFL